MSLSLYGGIAVKTAEAWGLPPKLVTCVVAVESGWNPHAWNPEPHYRWFWDVRRNAPFRPVTEIESKAEKPPTDFPCLADDPDQEWWAQQASWGLMQTMGAVARERGCTARYLPALCLPEVGLEYGCRHLAHLRDRHHATHGWDGVLAAYNTGSPNIGTDGRVYVAKVKIAGWMG